jgi:small GTP-binding protein
LIKYLKSAVMGGNVMTVEKETIKMALFGSMNAGKSTLLNALRDGAFKLDEKERPTDGLSYSPIEFKSRIFHVWDLSGDDQHRELAMQNMAGSQVILHCIDCSEELNDTLIKEQYDLIKEKVSENAKIIVVGTKGYDNIKKERLENIYREIDDKVTLFTKVDDGLLIDIKKLKENISQVGEQYLKIMQGKHNNELLWGARNTLIKLVKERFPHAENKEADSDECRKIKSAFGNLENKLLDENADINAAKEQFYTDCHKVLGPSTNTQIGKAILAVGAAVSLMIISGVIGFCIGLACGGWTGPGAIVPVLVGLGVGLLVGFGVGAATAGAGARFLLFQPNTEMKEVQKVMDIAEQFKP